MPLIPDSWTKDRVREDRFFTWRPSFGFRGTPSTSTISIFDSLVLVASSATKAIPQRQPVCGGTSSNASREAR